MPAFPRVDPTHVVAATVALVLFAAASPCAIAAPPDPPDRADLSRGSNTPAPSERDLTALLDARRSEALLSVREAARERRAARTATLRVVLGVCSLGGLLLLFTPLALRGRYRTSRRLLWKYSLASALLFAATVQLFTLLLIALWWVRGTKLSFSPKEVATSAAFEALKTWTDRLPRLGSGELEKAFKDVVEGRYDSIPSTLLGNLQTVREDLAPFQSIAGILDIALAASDYVPQLASIAACVLLLLAIRPLLVEIIQLAPRAVEGTGSAKGLVKRIARTLRGEFLASLALIGVLFFLYVVPSLLFRFSIDSAIRSIVDSAVLGFGLLASDRESSPLALYAALLGWLAYFVLASALAAASIILYVSRSQNLLRAKFQAVHPPAAAAGFWIPATLKLLWVFFLIAAYPLLVGLLGFVFDSATEVVGEPIDWERRLAWGALRAWIFLPIFWLVGGTKALRSLARRSARPQIPDSAER